MPLRALVAALLLQLAAVVPARAGALTGTVHDDTTPVANVVVLATPRGAAAATPAVPPRAVMDQKHLAFRPHVLPVQRGTSVSFVNSDDVEHNVFSPSDAEPFDLGTYGQSQSREVRFDRAGDVRVLCNIHMEMEAHIVVVDSPYFTVTDGKGAFALRELPAGEYEITVWRDAWIERRWTVRIDATGESRIDLEAGS